MCAYHTNEDTVYIWIYEQDKQTYALKNVISLAVSWSGHLHAIFFMTIQTHNNCHDCKHCWRSLSAVKQLGLQYLETTPLILRSVLVSPNLLQENTSLIPWSKCKCLSKCMHIHTLPLGLAWQAHMNWFTTTVTQILSHCSKQILVVVKRIIPNKLSGNKNPTI